jgi:hypothetical protein
LSYDSQTKIRVPKKNRYSNDEESKSDTYSSDSNDSSQGQNPVIIPAVPAPAVQLPPVVVQDQQGQIPPANDQALVDNDQHDLISNSSNNSEYYEVDENIGFDELGLDNISDNGSDSSSEYRLSQLLDLVEVAEEDEQLLRDLIRPRNKGSNNSSSADSVKSQVTRQKLLDLEKLIISPDDNIRHQAEYELGQFLDQHRKNQEKVKLENKEIISDEPDSEEEEAGILDKIDSPVSEKSDSEDSEVKLSEIVEKNETNESDEEGMNSAMSHTILQSEAPEDSWPNPSEMPPPIDDKQKQSIIHIDTRGCRITVRPDNLPPIPPPRPREIRGRAREDIWEWVSQSPATPAAEVTPQVNRKGRVIKPRPRYEPEDQEQKERELRQMAQQRQLENTQKRKEETNFQAQAQEATPVQGTSRMLDFEEEDTPRYDTRSTGTRPKTRSESKITTTKTPASKKTHLKRPASTTSKKSTTSQRSGKSNSKK